MIVSRFAMSQQCTRFVKGKFFLNDSGLSVSVKDDDLIQDFLNIAIFSLNDDIYALGRGTAQKNLNVDAFKELLIPVPPLAEQKRIVKTLDEKFAKIDKLKTATETNLKNAREIFNAELNSKLNVENDNLPQGWECKNLGEIFQVTDYVSNGSFASLRENVTYYSEPNYAILVRLVDFSNQFNPKKFVYVDKHAYDFLSKSSLVGGELIMCNIGATIGKCFICPKLEQPMTLGPNCISIKSENNEFFAYYFKSPYFKKLLNRIISKTTLEKFNKTQFKQIQIPLPPLSEQKRIVAHLDKLSEKVKRLEENYRRTIADCEEFKKSILKQVFEVET